MPQRILIVEDEPAIQSVLKALLSDAGYETAAAGDGWEAIAMFRQGRYDLVLLDILLPHCNGYAVCRAIREQGNTPIIMLTALEEEEAQVKAFALQADDYITKPFSLKLVLLRVEAVLRRTAAAGHGTILTYRDVRMDLEGMEVSSGGKTVSLTKLEYELLRLFLEHPGRVFTRENLLNMVWGYDYMGDEKAVNIHIMNLRRKLGVDLIETIRGVGYRLAKN